MIYIGQMVAIGYSLILIILMILFSQISSIPLFLLFAIVFMFINWLLGKWVDSLRHERQQLYWKGKHLLTLNTALQKSKHSLQQLYTSIDIMIFTYDLTSNQLYVSKGVEELFGISKQTLQIHPEKLQEFVHPDDESKFIKTLTQLHLGKSINAKYRILKNDHDIIWIHMKATPIFNSKKMVEKVNGTILDITEEKQLEAKLRKLAYFDELTELPNRLYLQRNLKKVLAKAKRRQYHVTLAFIDLDGFKKVNDKLGHDSGDLLLQEVAKRLSNVIREEDLLARLGGDEFIIVFEDTEEDVIKHIAERILSTVSEPFTLKDQDVSVSPSIGISQYPNDSNDIESLMNAADQAMYYAKRRGKNSFHIYDSSVDYNDQKKLPLMDRLMNTFTR
ncbi:sensor domain-containing protein [Halalkalibacter hemicellulosilyticus]|uniref:Diguanylate cyclase/phosphodiesterase n=1 Tax=Halalkalibacter hemicellulosilyticusJCM 9152 TaxID=1236971 RepID=W4QHI0_9BACI|nr:sensor domain-containing diguanylate cyclase [Halalkalibacter hemicellulosilyticus]GAE31560.1 diguanylate cyclase/phosphodiesterase [Halalkalibacter hemicellulosilyticusJCM 9152]